MTFISKALRGAWRLWLTGALYLFAGLGYCFYGILYLYRLMQTSRRAFIAVVVLVLLAAAGVAAWHLRARPTGVPVDIVVAPGQPFRVVAGVLRERRVVPSALGLRLWMKVSGRDRKVQAGEYFFVEGEGILSASDKLLHATPVEMAATIPEGLTIEQIASLVSSTFHVDSAQFVQICYDSASVNRYGFGTTVASLEGHLFPETYRFPPNVTAAEVVDRMVAHFKEEYAKLRVDSLVAGTLTQSELVTLASIVEKEAQVSSERTRIAGVFHNRLRLGIPLGADPTVRYFLRKFSGPLRVSELRRDSPYNTRVRTGLPPGPICSPGLAALQAAAAPMQTKDLYFVARWDGSGTHDFSRTLAEHERKKLEIRRQNEQRIRQMTQAERDSAAAGGTGE